jgi:glycogen debranching enzyme
VTTTTATATPDRLTVTLVAGTTFCLSGRSGDIRTGGDEGFFLRDTRVLSYWELQVDGEPLLPMAVEERGPDTVTFLGRAAPRPGRSDSTLLVERTREVDDGLRELVTLENQADEPVGCSLTLLLAADFADLFEVKAHRAGAGRTPTGPAGPHRGRAWTAQHRWMGHSRGVEVTAEADDGTPPLYQADLVSLRVLVPAHGRWSARLQVTGEVDGVALAGGGDSGQKRRTQRWRSRTPDLRSADEELCVVLRRSYEDLGVLQMVDADHPDRTVLAAGTPWYMSLFGRDSLLSAWMALPLDPTLAVGTLQRLAELQGTGTDPLTEEQPGRIMHELRLGLQPELALGGGHVYYGTVDATPLFVVLRDEARRWGAPARQVAALLPHADRALDWLTGPGDPDGDGFVEYRRGSDRGLVNQGWKDSSDGISSAAGRLARPPVALCEVQGYTYAAFLARARLADAVGDQPRASRWRDRAAGLKEAFDRAFWLPDRGWYALALDGDKQPADALASNMGHCLWSGIVPQERAAQVVARLVSDDLFSGWGVRTLARSMARYNPMAYHNGSVWPHDNAVLVAGLVRYGFVAEAQQVAVAVLEAATRFGGRLPELFCGFERDRYSRPVPYPTSCSPQAWAAGTPFSLLRSLLRLEPDLPAGRVRLDPVLPEAWLPFTVDGLRIGPDRVRVEVTTDGATVSGLSTGTVVDGRSEGRKN